jgi:hypothetical protein
MPILTKLSANWRVNPHLIFADKHLSAVGASWPFYSEKAGPGTVIRYNFLFVKELRLQPTNL